MGFQNDLRNLDTIMICLTSPGAGLSRVEVAKVLRRRDPSKYGAMTSKDVKDVLVFYFTHWSRVDMPLGLWADKFNTLRNGGAASEDMVRKVEGVLAGAKDELRIGGGEQGGAGKETQQVAEGAVEGVEGRE